MGTDKLWIDLYGRPVWRWSLDALLAAHGIERFAVVVPADEFGRFRKALPTSAADRCLLAPGGERRLDSVLGGLSVLGEAGVGADALVLVHDAARPAVRPELIERIVLAAGESGAVVPVVAMHDALKRVTAGRLDASVEREGLAAAQTPQLARLGELRAALIGAASAGRDVSDDAAALLDAGIEVRTVPGDPGNIKLTDPADVPLLRAVLREWARPVETGGPPISDAARVGIGFDAHRLEAGRPLHLGGVHFEGATRGLAGHSDGDVALHAVIDALLGAAGEGDIGQAFPSDERWHGADSAELVERTFRRLREKGWDPIAVDLTVVAAAPAIAPHREEMRARIGSLMGLTPDAISVKGTTSDGLGFAGSEGIAAYAVALVRRSAPQ